MRSLACVVGLVAVCSGAAAATFPAAKVAYRDGNRIVVLDLGTGERRSLDAPNTGPPRLSGDGELLSVGGTIVGRGTVSAGAVAWAPTGETAAFIAKDGSLREWTPAATHTIVPRAWGVTSFAWGPGGELALGRSVCRIPCGVPEHQEVWVWHRGNLRRVAGPLRGVQRPIVEGVDGAGRALWWADPQDSASIMADGLELYADRVPLYESLAYSDYVTPCGRRLAVAAGGDRYAMHGKRIMLDGRDLSRDTTRSWVSPSCSADGRTVVAAAGRNTVPEVIGNEHRSIWQLLPSRHRLTTPPAGWSDEYPRVLSDGGVLFVRTRWTSRRAGGAWQSTQTGRFMLRQAGRLTRLGVSTTTQAAAGDRFPTNYYGHYPWPDFVSVAR